MIHAILLFAGSVPAAFPVRVPASAPREVVAVRAGTILTVENGILSNGTILIDDGKITAIGADLDVPGGAHVVDYGPDAVIAPGLVAADSGFQALRPSERTADPAVMAADAFDPFASYVFALQEGVTSAYVPPARGRLIAGQGAFVKLAGHNDLGGAGRILRESVAIHGSVGTEARRTPGYWQPPLPATVDVGMGVEEPQLPRTLMGAITALGELVELARGGPDDGRYGPDTATQLRELIEAGRPWRMGASSTPEIRALLGFFQEKELPLVIDGASGAASLAGEIADSGFPVIVKSPILANATGRDFGKDRDAQEPVFDVAASLERAHVRFAIAPSEDAAASDLRFAAQIASRGGLDRAAALRAITLSPAEILGVSDRLGSLVPGKDADFAVFNGHPLEPGTSAIATWVDGKKVHERVREKTAVVLSVEELFVGDGEILRPGEVLIQDGKIREVGRRVGRPAGAEIVRGKAAMPGMIDALGHLGLSGSARVPATRFDLSRIVAPAELSERRVARAGVTTVVLSPRGASRSGAPMMAYKPAVADYDRMLVRNPVALRFQWTDRNRLESGQSLREILTKAVAYAKKWDEYEKKLAAWTPPKEEPKPEEAKSDDKKGSESDSKSDEGKKDESGDKAQADKKDEKKEEKKDEKKKKKGEKEPPKPITGAWETHVAVPPFEKARLRLYALDEEGKISGSLRCSSLSDRLIEISGERKETKVSLSGEANRGRVDLTLEEKDGKLQGKLVQGAASVEITLEQTSTEYEVAKRSERRKVKEEKKEIKGQPSSPGIDPELEPLRKAIQGQGAVVVGVEREDEILACVDAFEDAGIKPILLGATDAWKVAEKIRGRIAGVLLDQEIAATDPKTGSRRRNRYAEIVSAGIPIAFHSDAEEGAVDLPTIAAYAVSQGMGPEAALRALTSDAARMYAMHERVGRLAPGCDGDVALLDGNPLDVSTRVLRVWAGGEEVR
ncbi:MAG: amidohydrolase family protein [Planctomycetota bacterium]